LPQHSAVFSNGVCTAIDQHAQTAGEIVDLDGDILSRGYTDLQVNGGGGLLLNDDPSVRTIATIATAHHQAGTRWLLPTLITDTAEKTLAAIEATKQAIREKTAGIAGLHLEGPHLSVAKKGAHRAELVRPMTDTDLAMLTQAAQQLPLLKLTVAPENTTAEQVQQLTSAGALVALGHTNADYDTCMRYHRAGASCVTHLFNAMSQLGSREPGLAGAALDGDFSIGLIADAIHVHPTTIRLAWNAKQQKHRFYLVSDAMAVAGTSLTSFKLNDREIIRKNNRLTLQDGTLAGADLDLTHAIQTLHTQAGIDLNGVLRAAVTTPYNLLNKKRPDTGLPDIDLIGCKLADVIVIKKDLSQVRSASE